VFVSRGAADPSALADLERAVGALGVQSAIVLCDSARVDAMLGHFPDMRIAGRRAAMKVRMGLDSARVMLGSENPDQLRVIESSTTLRELQWTVGGLVRTLREQEPLEVVEEQDLTGALLASKYHVVRRIGQGGFGSVYEARDVQLDTRVAIKVLERN